MNRNILKFRFVGIAMFLGMLAVFAAVAMLLWNALMPDIFGLPSLNYVQMLGILALTRILFGGMGPLGGGRFIPHGGHGRDERLFHGNALREKWMSMSEEERKAFFEKEKGFHHFFHDRFSHKEEKPNE